MNAMVGMMFAFLVAVASTGTAQDHCGGQTSCEDVSAPSAVHSSAMLQVHSSSEKALSSVFGGAVDVAKSASCLPDGLQEKHVKAIRHYAALLATKMRAKDQPDRNHDHLDTVLLSTKMRTKDDPDHDHEHPDHDHDDAHHAEHDHDHDHLDHDHDDAHHAEHEHDHDHDHLDHDHDTLDHDHDHANHDWHHHDEAEHNDDPNSWPHGHDHGDHAELNAEGFHHVTSHCCPAEMESFFNRVLEKEGLIGCSKPHIQGLMHWFTCVPSMEFEFVLDIIRNGNPCKYWTKIGTTCPVLTPQCQGQWCR